MSRPLQYSSGQFVGWWATTVSVGWVVGQYTQVSLDKQATTIQQWWATTVSVGWVVGQYTQVSLDKQATTVSVGWVVGQYTQVSLDKQATTVSVGWVVGQYTQVSLDKQATTIQQLVGWVLPPNSSLSVSICYRSLTLYRCRNGGVGVLLQKKAWNPPPPQSNHLPTPLHSSKQWN